MILINCFVYFLEDKISIVNWRNSQFSNSRDYAWPLTIQYFNSIWTVGTKLPKPFSLLNIFLRHTSCIFKLKNSQISQMDRWTHRVMRQKFSVHLKTMALQSFWALKMMFKKFSKNVKMPGKLWLMWYLMFQKGRGPNRVKILTIDIYFYVSCQIVSMCNTYPQEKSFIQDEGTKNKFRIIQLRASWNNKGRNLVL